MAKKEVIIGADHAGYSTKEKIKRYLLNKNIPILDVGTFSKEPIDYPDIAKRASHEVIQRKTKGILICGTGTGMCIAANRINGIRASVAYDEYSAKMARKDNDANIICLRGRNFPVMKAAKLVEVFLKSKFSKESRHKRRIKKIDSGKK